MKKSVILILSFIIGLSALVACSDQSTEPVNKTEKNSKSAVAVDNETTLLQSGSTEYAETTSVTTEKAKHSTTAKADNDIDFAETDTTAKSDKKTETTSSAVAPSTTESETTASSKSKTKITTDKDGWVDKWY